ncbi:MAG: ATPase [Candidatus Omnitrophota bacterium]|nr:MAG: ATPase [Candidatus Omnitrophota bacterium]
MEKERLKRLLKEIDGKGYKSYKKIEGVYNFGEYILFIDHVQPDPFAPPSKLRIRIPQEIAGFPYSLFSNESREIALRDFLTRKFYSAIKKISKGKRGSGKSGIISIDKPGQEILERTSVIVKREFVEVRFSVGLPAFGRKISSKNAQEIFFKEIPEIVKESLFFKNLNKAELTKHIEVTEDADFLREKLPQLNLVAFVADGSILPRKSGIEDKPLKEGKVIPFKSPEELKIEIELPNNGKISGMGIREGVTLIVGGGFHGKSTLLEALQFGIYNHIPGDGREFVVTSPWCVKIRAEDGRRVEKVDISPFIKDLPFGKKTEEFSTEDASGSTSQASNIIEALEAGAKLLLIDEDTSATNFMIRDRRMQRLVSKEKEPITPFIDKVRQLYRDYGVSTILVMGGSGDYFDVADCVICMVDYLPYDVTKKAKEICLIDKAQREKEGGESFGKITERIPLPESIDARKGKKEVKISPKGLYSIVFGKTTIDLSCVEQLVDVSQTKAIGDAIFYLKKYIDGKRTLREVVEMVMDDIERYGLDILSKFPVGDYASFRKFELIAAINRLRTLKVIQKR